MKGAWLFLAIMVVATLAAPDADLVPSLKGYYDFSNEFKMYSGYLELQKEPLITTHYVFVTSKNAPATDDVVLWLNGGPGCSSLLGISNPIQDFYKNLDHTSSTKELISCPPLRILTLGTTTLTCSF